MHNLNELIRSPFQFALHTIEQDFRLTVPGLVDAKPRRRGITAD
jgi:hypothetical protein